MSRPTHTKSGRKISDDLTDDQACFAEWLSDVGQELIGQASTISAQRLSGVLEMAFAAGIKSVNASEIKATSGRAGFIAGIALRSLGACNDWDAAADQYAERVKDGK